MNRPTAYAGTSGVALPRQHALGAGGARRLLEAVESGRVPAGCASAVLVDRDAANALRRIGFAG